MHNLSLFRLYLDSEGKCIPAGLVPLLNVLKIIPISTVEDERGFSTMNMVSTDLRTFTNHREYQCPEVFN